MLVENLETASSYGVDSVFVMKVQAMSLKSQAPTVDTHARRAWNVKDPEEHLDAWEEMVDIYGGQLAENAPGHLRVMLKNVAQRYRG